MTKQPQLILAMILAVIGLVLFLGGISGTPPVDGGIRMVLTAAGVVVIIAGGYWLRALSRPSGDDA